ncbi:TPA: hypothetical protein ACX6NP_002783 [Photobacterium damselae]
MKMKQIYFILLIVIMPFSAEAINVGPITSIINSKEDVLVRKISNNTDEARVVLIQAIEVSEPTSDGTVISRNPKNLLLSPSKIILPAKSESNIKFYYNGPKDDKERYYRVIWRDSNISSSDESTSKKKAVATSSALIGTILVVSPRKEIFKYEFTKDNILINKGNRSYHSVGYGPCTKNKKERCKEDYYDLPGTKRKFKNIDLKDKKSFLGVWHEDNFINIK